VTAVATPTLDATATAFAIDPPTVTPSPTPVPPIKQLTDGGCCVQPAWSPDSQQVWFLDKPSPDAPVGIYAVRIDQPLTEPFRVLDLIGLYSRDLSLVAYPEGRDTIVERLSDGERWVIPNRGHEVIFSPDGKRIAWEIEEIDGPFDQRRTDVYLARFTGEDAVLVATVYGGGFQTWLDEQRILFSGRPSLAVRERTLTVLGLGSNVAVDLVTAERISGITASADGSWLAYFISFNDDAARNSIWVQRTDGSEARRLDFWGAYQWRDDARLLYIPMRQSSPDEPFVIWEYDTATDQSRPVTDAATAPIQIANGDWRVSPDGRYVVYVNSADLNLWLVELKP
jgi:Tol biopolymer transport system component